MRETGSSQDLSFTSILALVSVLPLFLIGAFAFYQGVVNTIRVLSDKPYKYALSIPFIK